MSGTAEVEEGQVELATLYRDIVESSPDAIWVFDLEGRMLYANPALCALFGATAEEMRSVTVFDTLDDTGKSQFAEHLEQLRAGAVNDGEVETQFVRRDGSTVWVSLSESLLGAPGGAVGGVLHRLSDYSDRRQTVDDLTISQRRLADAQRIARIGSWEWEISSDVIWASDELIALYGHDRESFPTSSAGFLAIVRDEHRAHVEAAVRGALRDGGSFVFVAQVRRVDDTWTWTRGRGVAQTDGSGRVTHMYGTHQDITETKQAELALEDQVRQNTLLQAVASAANEATTLVEVLTHARHLVLLHDDWERGRGVPARRGPERRRTALHLRGRPPRRPADSRGDGDGARARQPGLPRAAAGVGRGGADDRVHRRVRRRGRRRPHHHLGAAALPLRDGRVDGRTGGRPSSAGSPSASASSASSPTPVTARWRRRGRSRSSSRR